MSCKLHFFAFSVLLWAENRPIRTFKNRKSPILEDVKKKITIFVVEFRITHIYNMKRNIHIRPFRGHNTAWLTGLGLLGMQVKLRLFDSSEE